jgi:hypothetical protein
MGNDQTEMDAMKNGTMSQDETIAFMHKLTLRVFATRNAFAAAMTFPPAGDLDGSTDMSSRPLIFGSRVRHELNSQLQHGYIFNSDTSGECVGVFMETLAEGTISSDTRLVVGLKRCDLIVVNPKTLDEATQHMRTATCPAKAVTALEMAWR